MDELFNTFLRVRDFGVTNSADFPADSKGGINFKLFIDKVPLIEASSAIKESNDGATKTKIKEAAAALLLDYMRKINRTARAAGVDHPEVGELFRMPHGSSYQKLIAAANAFLTNALVAETKGILVEYGLPISFHSLLRRRIDDLQELISEHNEIKDSKVGATASIESITQELSDALRRLRGIVWNTYEDNPAKLAEWTSASHIKQPPKREKKDEPAK